MDGTAMMLTNLAGIDCPQPTLRPGAQGMLRVEVSADQRTLTVTFATAITAALLDPARFTLTGGRRVHPQVVQATGVSGAVTADLGLDQPGDFSIYMLTLLGDDVDPFYASLAFSFKVDCEDPFDCKPASQPQVPIPESPAIDYLAKDYASFKRALLDLIPSRVPEWTDRSEADLGIVLIELMAYTADQLSDYQDRVANEAYLRTARQRRSVQLHSALIGYQMHNGAAARTFLYFNVTRDGLISQGAQVQTIAMAGELPVIFETDADQFVFVKHNAMSIYNWDNASCCLERGATSATLLGEFGDLRAGDAILIADTQEPPRYREVVVLTADPQILPPDPIKGHPTLSLTRIRWAESQALQNTYCLDDSATIARGNMVVASHGKTITNELIGLGDESLKRPRYVLSQAPLTYTLTSADSPLTQAASSLRVVVGDEAWTEQVSLLESGPLDHVYRVELDDDGYATVVFGDGTFGQKPPTGTPIIATYRIGTGPRGNLGRDTLTRPSEEGSDKLDDWITRFINPLPATGGVALQPKDEARRVAPDLIQSPFRCVTEADYEDAAVLFKQAGLRRVQRARARFVWTGSWYTVFVTIDPVGSTQLTASLRDDIRDFLHARKLAGYDLEIVPPVYAPLELALRVCVKAEFFAADVKRAVARALSAAINDDGTRGFFFSDNFTFGDPVFISQLLAAVEAVPGVASVQIVRFARLHERDPEQARKDNIKQGYLAIDPMEIARLDNDPSFPENGQLVINVVGGK